MPAEDSVLRLTIVVDGLANVKTTMNEAAATVESAGARMSTGLKPTEQMVGKVLPEDLARTAASSVGLSASMQDAAVSAGDFSNQAGQGGEAVRQLKPPTRASGVLIHRS